MDCQHDDLFSTYEKPEVLLAQRERLHEARSLIIERAPP